jgi:glutathione S-transferase
MTDIILHHYPISPYAEKIRLALGLKNLSWRSVDIPMILPKPDVIALTGGYRKTPIMQIGADVYCDTACILRELEKRHPTPSVYPVPEADALSNWADSKMFMPAVGVAFAYAGDKFPKEFMDERSKFIGRPIDAAQFKAALPYSADQLRVPLVTWERMLSDGRPFLLGRTASAVDLSAYHPLWFVTSQLGQPVPPLVEFKNVLAWMGRVKAIGHGKPTALSSNEALEIAKKSTPVDAAAIDGADPSGLKPNDTISVTPDDMGRDPTVGELVSSNALEIVIRRTDPRAGTVHVHFPRLGYMAMRA